MLVCASFIRIFLSSSFLKRLLFFKKFLKKEKVIYKGREYPCLLLIPSVLVSCIFIDTYLKVVLVHFPLGSRYYDRVKSARDLLIQDKVRRSVIWHVSLPKCYADLISVKEKEGRKSRHQDGWHPTVQQKSPT